MLEHPGRRSTFLKVWINQDESQNLQVLSGQGWRMGGLEGRSTPAILKEHSASPVRSSLWMLLPLTFREVSFVQKMWLMGPCLHTRIISLWRVSSDGQSFVLMRQGIGAQCPRGPQLLSHSRPQTTPNMGHLCWKCIQREESCGRVWMDRLHMYHDSR